MLRLNDLREKRAATVESMRALADKAEGEMPEDDAKKFDELRKENEDLEKRIERAQALEEAERRMSGTPLSDKRGDLESRVSIVRAIRGQMQGKLDGAELEYSQEAERRSGRTAQGIFVPMGAFETRTATTSNAGETVGTDHRADQYIGPLRNALLARRLGVRVLSGLRGDVSIPKHGSSASVGWVAEEGNLSESDMTFDNVTLSPKHAGGISEMSRQLIQQSSPDIEDLVREDLAAVVAQSIDSALIEGGGANEPVGVLGAFADSGRSISTGTLATPSWSEVLAMIQTAEGANVTPNSWLMSPAAKKILAETEKSSGTGEYLLAGGRMADIPAFSTSQVPQASSAEEFAILGDWSQVLLGIWSEVDILVNPYESTAYQKGAVKIRAMSTVDVAIRHDEAFVVADDV